MKGIRLNWEQLQRLNKDQTSIQVTYKYKDKEDYTRILIGGFEDRLAAWNWCKKENLKNTVTYDKEQKPVQIVVNLYSLKKIYRRLDSERPKRTEAWVVNF